LRIIRKEQEENILEADEVKKKVRKQEKEVEEKRQQRNHCVITTFTSIT
jgi:hypothetical protein